MGSLFNENANESRFSTPGPGSYEISSQFKKKKKKKVLEVYSVN